MIGQVFSYPTIDHVYLPDSLACYSFISVYLFKIFFFFTHCANISVCYDMNLLYLAMKCRLMEIRLVWAQYFEREWRIWTWYGDVHEGLRVTMALLVDPGEEDVRGDSVHNMFLCWMGYMNATQWWPLLLTQKQLCTTMEQSTASVSRFSFVFWLLCFSTTS